MGSDAYSAYVPRTVSPSKCQLRHKLSFPSRQNSHVPHPRLALMTTRSPISNLQSLLAVALIPDLSPSRRGGSIATISPAPSAPLICGSSSFKPGHPLRTMISKRLRAAACKRISASPGFGSGVRKSVYSNTSGPPCTRKRTTFMLMIVTDSIVYFEEYRPVRQRSKYSPEIISRRKDVIFEQNLTWPCLAVYQPSLPAREFLAYFLEQRTIFWNRKEGSFLVRGQRKCFKVFSSEVGARVLWH